MSTIAVYRSATCCHGYAASLPEPILGAGAFRRFHTLYRANCGLEPDHPGAKATSSGRIAATLRPAVAAESKLLDHRSFTRPLLSDDGMFWLIGSCC
jgi:hypothetical protein